MMASAAGNIFAKLPQSLSEEVFQEIIHGEDLDWSESSLSARQHQLGNGMTRSSMNGLYCYPAQRACVSKEKKVYEY